MKAGYLEKKNIIATEKDTIMFLGTNPTDSEDHSICTMKTAVLSHRTEGCWKGLYISIKILVSGRMEGYLKVDYM